jgi:hypothetical protein
MRTIAHAASNLLTHIRLSTSVVKHLVLQASNRLLERPSLTLKPPIPIDFGSERPITNLTYSFVYVVVPHVVGIEKPKYVVSDGRGRNVDIDDRHGMNLAVIGGAVT